MFLAILPLNPIKTELSVRTLKTIEYTLGNTPTHSVICMHGLGASNDDLRPIAQALALPNLRFVFPQAPRIPVTINHGHAMPGWYDVRSMDFASAIRSDHAGVDASCDAIKILLANEQAQYGIKPENTFLMGFSQGGSIALELGLHDSQRFAGLIGLSTLPAKGIKTFEHLSQENRATPIFLAHGSRDNVVPFVVGEHIRDILTEKKYQIEWCTVAEDHTIWPEEIAALKQWFLRVIK
jgi:phospholipase/carboxylesterase